MDKPLIAHQLERLYNVCCRIFAGEYKGVLCLGPPGIGKNVIIERAAADTRVQLTLVQNATLFGIAEELRCSPAGNHWLNEFDAWLDDKAIRNFLKIAMEKTNPAIVAINQNTLRSGGKRTPFPGHILITSNANFDALAPARRGHVEALSDRFQPVMISWKPQDRLDYIDWLVCEDDYFRSKTFWQHEKIKPLSLREIQDVLCFLHKHADRLQLTLRTLNDLARERKNRPETWEAECRGMVRTSIDFNAPPAPIVPGYRKRFPEPLKARSEADFKGRGCPHQPPGHIFPPAYTDRFQKPDTPEPEAKLEPTLEPNHPSSEPAPKPPEPDEPDPAPKPDRQDRTRNPISPALEDVVQFPRRLDPCFGREPDPAGVRVVDPEPEARPGHEPNLRKADGAATGVAAGSLEQNLEPSSAQDDFTPPHGSPAGTTLPKLPAGFEYTVTAAGVPIEIRTSGRGRPKIFTLLTPITVLEDWSATRAKRKRTREAVGKTPIPFD